MGFFGGWESSVWCVRKSERGSCGEKGPCGWKRCRLRLHWGALLEGTIEWIVHTGGAEVLRVGWRSKPRRTILHFSMRCRIGREKTSCSIRRMILMTLSVMLWVTLVLISTNFVASVLLFFTDQYASIMYWPLTFFVFGVISEIEIFLRFQAQHQHSSSRREQWPTECRWREKWLWLVSSFHETVCNILLFYIMKQNILFMLNYLWRTWVHDSYKLSWCGIFVDIGNLWTVKGKYEKLTSEFLELLQPSNSLQQWHKFFFWCIYYHQTYT